MGKLERVARALPWQRLRSTRRRVGRALPEGVRERLKAGWPR